MTNRVECGFRGNDDLVRPPVLGAMTLSAYFCAAVLAMTGCVSGSRASAPAWETMQPGGHVIQYPPIFREANVGGSVTLQFVLDSAGRMPSARPRTVRTSHEILTFSFRNSLRRWWFPLEGSTPSWYAGDTITAEARFVVQDGPHCPHPRPCVDTVVVVLPAREYLEWRDRTHPVVVAVTCPQPVISHCVS